MFCILFTIVIIILFLAFCYYIYKNTEGERCKNKFFDIIPLVLYINLENRKDRKIDFLKNFNVNDESKNVIRIDAFRTPENGALGCLKSHIKALETALELANEYDYPYILICEDDFHIKNMKYCVEMISYFMKNVKKWDVLMLGHNTIQSKKTHFRNIIKIIESQTTSAYLIKINYIPKLLDIYKRDLAEYERTGVWGNYYTDQSWKQLQKVDNWYAIEPRVGVQREGFSDIQGGNVDYKV